MAGEDKDFIKEKIIGRNISFKNAVKRILLASMPDEAFSNSTVSSKLSPAYIFSGTVV